MSLLNYTSLWKLNQTNYNNWDNLMILDNLPNLFQIYLIWFQEYWRKNSKINLLPVKMIMLITIIMIKMVTLMIIITLWAISILQKWTKTCKIKVWISTFNKILIINSSKNKLNHNLFHKILKIKNWPSKINIIMINYKIMKTHNNWTNNKKILLKILILTYMTRYQ